MFQNRVVWRIFACKREEVRGGSEKCVMRSFRICTYYRILLERKVEGRQDV
jgi:hypothetical protein